MKITNLLYRKLISSDLSDENLRSREVVLNWLLFGLFCLATAAFASSFITLVFLGLAYVWPRLVAVSIFLGLLAVFHSLVRKRHLHRLVAGILLVMIFGAAIMVLYLWGLLTPTGLLLISLVVVMAGILLGSRYSLYMVVASVCGLVILEYSKVRGFIIPDLEWMKSGGSNVSDVVVFSCIYAILGMTCWLFNRQMETSLSRATEAEAKLLKQNEGLEEKVLARTQELEKEQLERMQSMYRFAELGHVSTALFHDLANHLSTVSLDIENLHKKTHPEILHRIDDNIHYIDTIVQRVRSQLRGELKIETFDIKAEIREVAKVSALNSKGTGTTIELNMGDDQPLLFEGDTMRFRQVIINLLSNAAESYCRTKISANKRAVNVDVTTDGSTARIEVSDNGPGIPESIRDRIFDPFYTSKQEGVGIGLFIVSQVVDRDLKGEVELVKTGPEGTTFGVNIPLVHR